MASCSAPRGHRLEVDDLTVGYGGIRALEGVGFANTCGRSLALVGPNGAGKSTLMKALAGLLPPGGGTIHWRGRQVTGSDPEIAYLAQRSEIDWNFPLTVRGLVAMGRYPHVSWWRRFSAKDDAVVDAALESMRMADLAGRQISALSGGQQQRAFVARALAQEAHVLLLDEPFTGLDLPAQDMLVELLHELTASGRLIIAAHHDLDTVAEIFDDVLMLNRRVIASGPVMEVYTPDNLEACFGSKAGLAQHRSPANGTVVVPLSS